MSVVSSKLSSTMTILLDELREECLSTIRLIHQLELEHLTDEQIEEVLGELILKGSGLRGVGLPRCRRPFGF